MEQRARVMGKIGQFDVYHILKDEKITKQENEDFTKDVSDLEKFADKY